MNDHRYLENQSLIGTELENFCRIRSSIFYFKTDIPISDEEIISLQKKKDEEIDILIPFVIEVSKKVFKKDVFLVVPLHGLGTFHWLYKLYLLEDKHYIFCAVIRNFPYLGFRFIIDNWVMVELKRRGLPSLDIVSVDLSRELCTFDYEIIEEARGYPLANFDSDNMLYIELSFKLGQIIGLLHNIPCSGFGLVDIKHILKYGEAKGVFNSWKNYIFLNLERHIKICLDIGAISPDEAKQIEVIFESCSSMLDCTVPCLLHGDLGPHNIFSDGHSITAIIDWEDCLVGDAVFDIAFWGTFYMNDYKDRLNALVEGYKTKHLLPSDFELRYWLYYLRIALSKMVHRYRFKYPDPIGKMPASFRIKKGLRKVQKLFWH